MPVRALRSQRLGSCRSWVLVGPNYKHVINTLPVRLAMASRCSCPYVCPCQFSNYPQARQSGSPGIGPCPALPDNYGNSELSKAIRSKATLRPVHTLAFPLSCSCSLFVNATSTPPLCGLQNGRFTRTDQAIMSPVLRLDYGSTNAGKTTILEKMAESEAETGSLGQIWALGGMAILSCVYHVQASQ